MSAQAESAQHTIVSEDSGVRYYYQFEIYSILHQEDPIRVRWLYGENTQQRDFIFVRLQTDALKAHRETSSDVMVNLFKGYLASLDIEFQQYIKQKKMTTRKDRT